MQGLINALTPAKPLSINSREIAELVESRHDSVKRTIERLANQNVIAHPPTVDVQETGGNNRTYTTTAYLFTGEQGKRDSIVIVAQLSPEFTARLVDRWQELESKARLDTAPSITTVLSPLQHAKDALVVMDEAVQVLQRWGFDKNACLISANHYTRKHAQIDVLADTGNTHLLAENQASLYFTPTELGLKCGGLSAFKINKLLETAGLQRKEAGHWLPTEEGRPHARLLDTSKAHSNGALIQQIKWADSVLPLIECSRS